MTNYGFSSLSWMFRGRSLFASALVACCTLASGAETAPRVDNYQLGAGDNVRISVFQNPDLTLETRISEDGMVNYPLVGPIRLGGLEISRAETTVAKALQTGGFLKNPQVNIALLRILGNTVSVLGQVNKPGSYPIETANTHLSKMLADAGGIATGGADTVIVTGTRAQQAFRREVDIDALYRANEPGLDVEVAGGDSIYVPRAAQFFIYGEVTRPGSYRLERDMTMRAALAAGGGLTLRGTERRLKVIRKNAQGVAEKLDADLNDRVRPDDVIYVNESIF